MRISHDHPAAAKIAMVYLNGEPQKHCITFDTNTGELTRYVTRNGKFVAVDDCLLTETVTGEITFDIANRDAWLLGMPA